MKKNRSVIASLLALTLAIAFAGGCAAPGQTNEPEATQPPVEKPAATQSATAQPEATQPTAEEPAATDSMMNMDTLFGDFKTVDLDGNQVGPEIFADYDLTMVNIWATYCGPCISEMPELGELSEEYVGRGLGIVGIVVDAADYDGNPVADQVEAAKALVKKTEANYLHILPSADLISGYLSQVQAVPTTVFVDADGVQVGKAYVGSRDKDSWIEVIDGLLPEVCLPG